MRWGVIPALALAMLAAGLLGATAASAAPPASARFPGSATLTGVSCPASSWCMAVGSYTTRSHVRHPLAQVWNGRTWRVLRPAGRSLAGVSCTATWFCLATGGPTGAQRWNGTTWREIPGPQDAVSAPSCGSRSLCMVLNGTARAGTHGVAESWNGTRWRTWWQDTNVCAQGAKNTPCALTGISCGSAADCVAVGSFSQYLYINDPPSILPGGFTWNGKRWAPAALTGLGGWWADGGSSMDAVSCTGSFCLAAGGNNVTNTPVTAAWNGATQSWAPVTNNLDCDADGVLACTWDALSCGTGSRCMAFTYPAGDQLWNGGTWTAAPSVGEGDGSLLGAPSCHASDCLAVGYQTHQHVQRTLAELWNGTRWTVLATPNLT
jgi:hypothetical protein